MLKVPGVALLVAGLLTGCGQSEDSAAERNDAAIQQASQAPDALAEQGEEKVRRVLIRELGMDADGDFRLDPDQPTECEREAEQMREGGIEIECVGGTSDCYVKTGAEAVNFEHMSEHMLYSPNGRDLVFVQTSQGVPLHGCLTAVRDSLNW
jgi:hypothetical protein